MSKSTLGFLKDARFKVAAVLSALGVSGVAFAMNQNSCTFTVDTVPVDAGVAGEGEGDQSVPHEPGTESVAPEEQQ